MSLHAVPDTGELLTTVERETLDCLAQAAYNLQRRIMTPGPSSTHDVQRLVGMLASVQEAVLAQAAARVMPHRYRLLGTSRGRWFGRVKP